MSAVPLELRARAELERRRREEAEGRVVSGVVYMPRRTPKPVPPADVDQQAAGPEPVAGRDVAAKLAAAMDAFKRTREREGR